MRLARRLCRSLRVWQSIVGAWRVSVVAEASAAYQCARADSRVPRQALRRYARRLDGAALDCVDYARKRVFKVLAYVRFDHCVCFIVCQRLGIVQELPDDALVRFSVLVAVQRLVVRAAR